MELLRLLLVVPLMCIAYSMEMHNMHDMTTTESSMDMMSNDSMTHTGSMPGHGGHMKDDDMNHTGHGTTSDKMDHSGHNSPSGSSAAHHVNTFFFLGTEATILFEQWVASSYTMFIGSCLAIGIISMLYEGLKLIRDILCAKERVLMYDKGCCSSGCSCLHLVQTLLHMVQIFISYCLMLVFMLFNTWLCLSIILGSGLGYLIFGWKKRSLVSLKCENEHCN